MATGAINLHEIATTEMLDPRQNWPKRGWLLLEFVARCADETDDRIRARDLR
jgi:hypothetical protein